MPTTLSVYDAKAKFSSVLTNVEEKRMTVTILRYGHPIAQIVPIRQKARSLSPDPALAGRSRSTATSLPTTRRSGRPAVKPILLDRGAVLWLADRFIIATALAGNIPIVTADRRFAQYGVETLR